MPILLRLSRAAPTQTLRFSYVVLAVLLGAPGCHEIKVIEGAGTTPISLSTAVGQLESDLSNVQILSLSDLDALVPASTASQGLKDDVKKRILDNIAQNQCFSTKVETTGGVPRTVITKARIRNPLIPVITGALQVTVQGQFTESGTFAISAQPSIGGTASRQTAQQIMLPISLVSLVNLPKFYISQQLANLQYLPLTGTGASGAPPVSRGGDYVKDVMEQADELDKLVKLALATYDRGPDAYCSAPHGNVDPNLPHKPVGPGLN